MSLNSVMKPFIFQRASRIVARSSTLSDRIFSLTCGSTSANGGESRQSTMSKSSFSVSTRPSESVKVISRLCISNARGLLSIGMMGSISKLCSGHSGMSSRNRKSCVRGSKGYGFIFSTSRTPVCSAKPDGLQYQQYLHFLRTHEFTWNRLCIRVLLADLSTTDCQRQWLNASTIILGMVAAKFGLAM